MSDVFPIQSAQLPIQTVTSSPSNDGDSAAFFALWLKNIVLTVLTLGIYRFWGKVAVRRYLWRHTILWQDRFEYTGTPMELLRGFAKAMLIYGPGFLLFSLASTWLSSSGWVAITLVSILTAPVMPYLIYFAGFSARRYRLSRTRWRGIQGGLSGSPHAYALLALKYLALTAVTFGVAYPYQRVALYRYATENTYFGSERFEFSGDGKDLLGPWILTMLLFLPTLSLSGGWYHAKQMRYVVSHTSLKQVKVDLEITPWQWLGFMGINGLMVLFSFGLALPFVIMRTLKFVVEHIKLTGTPDFAAMGQSTQIAPKSGEGLFDLLDADIA